MRFLTERQYEDVVNKAVEKGKIQMAVKIADCARKMASTRYNQRHSGTKALNNFAEDIEISINEIERGR